MGNDGKMAELETATIEAEALYTKYLQNKSVVIVGGKDNYDSIILKSYDIVVRINNHYVRQRGPCDVVYNTVKSPNLRLDALASAPGFRPSFVFLKI